MIVKENIQFGEGGEIISGEIQHIKKVKLDEFCQVYLKDNSEFYSLSKAESNVLAVCMYLSVYYDDDEIQYPGNKVNYDALFKDTVLKKTGLKEGTLKNTMMSLVRKDMLLRNPNYKGIYFLNPKYFFKGTINNRTKVIKSITEYQII